MKKSILLIEDDVAIRENFCEILEAEYFQVVDAENGLVGLQLAKYLQPDLILCDVNMPKLNGYGVLQKLREDATIAKTPFIFLTSESAAVNRHQALQLGANDYLNKSIRISELLAAIVTHLQPKIQ